MQTISYPAPTLIMLLSAAMKSLAECGTLSELHPTQGYLFASGTRVKRKHSPVPKYVYFLLLTSVEFLEFQEEEQ